MGCLWWLLSFFLCSMIALGETEKERLCSPPTVTVTNQSKSSLSLSFSCPSGNTSDASACHTANYSVLFRPTHSVTKDFMVRISFTTMFLLDRLIPFTSYDIKVKTLYGHSHCNSSSITNMTLPLEPRPPTNVRIVSKTATTVTIAWDVVISANGTVDKYRVEYRTSSAPSSALKGSKTTSITLTDLRPYTDYNFTVRSRVKFQAGSPLQGMPLQYWSEKSDEMSFKTRQARPSPPRDVHLSQGTLSSTSVEISWKKPLSPNGIVSLYYVYYRPVGSDLKHRTVRDATSIQLKNLIPFAKYAVWVVAVNVEGGAVLTSRVAGAEITQFTTLVDAPSQPHDVNVSNVRTNSVDVTWQAPAKPNGRLEHLKYKILLQNGSLPYPTKKIVVTGGTIRRYTVTGLTQLTRYSLKIIAVNVDQTDEELQSPPSQVVNFTTTAGPRSAPQTIRSSVSVTVGGVSAVITWQPPADVPRPITLYWVTCMNMSDIVYRPFYSKDITDVRERKATLSNLMLDEQYRVRIVGHLSSGVARISVWTSSGYHTFTTNQAAPSPPRSLLIQSISSKSVTVSWAPPLQANGVLQYYKIFLQSGDSRPPSDLNRGSKNVSVPQRQVVLRRLTPITTYFVWVAAINVRGIELISELTGPVSFTTAIEAPSPPRNVAFSNVTSYSVVVRWSQPTTVYGILHEYNISLTPISLLKIKQLSKTVSGQNVSTAFGNLLPYTRYIIHVRAAGRKASAEESQSVWSPANEDNPPVDFTTKQSSPSSPLGVRSTNILSRSAWIQWELPSRPNGEIQFYIVSLYEKVDDSLSVSVLNSESMWIIARRNRTKNRTRRMELSALSPYTLYGVSVRAVNVVNEVELPGEETKVILFTTKDEVPSAPRSCTVDYKNSSSIRIVWQPPAPFDYKVAFYDVTVNCTSKRQPAVHSMTVNSTSVQLSGLLPFTEYVVAVSASTNNTKLLTGPPCNTRTKTGVGVPPAPRKPQLVPNVTQTKSTVVLILPTLNETNGPIRFVEVTVVELKPGVLWPENTPLPNTEDSRVANIYVAKEIPSSHGDSQFVVGTGEDHNVTLKPSTIYAFYVQWIAQEQGSQKRLESAASPAAVYTTPPRQSKPVTSTSSSKSSLSTVTIAVVVAVALLVTIIAVILVIWIRRRKRALPPSMSDKESYDLNFATDLPLKPVSTEQTRNETDGLPVYASCVLERIGTRRVAIIEEFKQHIDKLRADENEGFVTEFEEMAEVGVEQSIAFATNADNNNKNRYRNIVPYDDHCLTLDEVDGMEILETDYINATYIDGFSRSKKYIVAQGPLSHTCADFWRMVWIEKVEAIVMLTRTVESGKQKCFKYWSDDDTKEYEGLTVEVQLQNEMADCKVRKMKIKLLDEVRHVMHYYFRSWPDHGVPTHATDLLGLIYRVRRDSGTSNAPLVVHCSAGVGRSGTYVTIDTLLSAIESNKSIDVNSTVRKLRMKRMQMVQSVMQYILIHEAVLEACFTWKTEISTADFTKEFAKLQDFKEEFNILLKLGRPLDKSEFKTGLLPAVLRRKNRDSLFIPPDSVRVVLHVDDDSTDADYVNTEEGADYINASYVNGYYKRNLFIVTQAPLPSTLTDMWKMVFQQNATAIVNLAQPNECQQYWPSSGSESYGHLNVNWLSSDNGKAFTVYKMQLIKRKSTRDIALFHYHGWSNDAPPSDIAGLMEMMAQLEQWQRKTQGNRMIVHCCTGMGRSGVFCAVYNLLDQTKSERIANVLHVTKVLLNQRPGIIHTPEQYEGIYSITNRYLQEGVTYVNTK